jgi:hypothetical protein
MYFSRLFIVYYPTKRNILGSAAAQIPARWYCWPTGLLDGPGDIDPFVQALDRNHGLHIVPPQLIQGGLPGKCCDC